MGPGGEVQSQVYINDIENSMWSAGMIGSWPSIEAKGIEAK